MMYNCAVTCITLTYVLEGRFFSFFFVSRTSGRCIFNAFVHSCTRCCIFTMLSSHGSDTHTWAPSRYVTTGKYSTKYLLTSHQRVFCAQCKSLCSNMLIGRVTACHSSVDFPAKLAAQHTNLCKTYTTNVRTLGLLRFNHTATAMHQHPSYTAGKFNYD